VNALKRIFEELDPLLHERGRLAIASVLAAVDSLTFTELRDELAMTDGNLSVHLQKLEEKGYVAISKQFVGRRPQTTCRLIPAGRRAFAKYLTNLETIVQQGRGSKGA
jgi:DNA-binding MarR family transcriptional regulator